MKVPARGLPSIAAQFARAEPPGAVCLSRLTRFARVLATGDHAPADAFPRRSAPRGAGPFRWALIPAVAISASPRRNQQGKPAVRDCGAPRRARGRCSLRSRAPRATCGHPRWRPACAPSSLCSFLKGRTAGRPAPRWEGRPFEAPGCPVGGRVGFSPPREVQGVRDTWRSAVRNRARERPERK